MPGEIIFAHLFQEGQVQNDGFILRILPQLWHCWDAELTVYCSISNQHLPTDSNIISIGKTFLYNISDAYYYNTEWVNTVFCIPVIPDYEQIRGKMFTFLKTLRSLDP